MVITCYFENDLYLKEKKFSAKMTCQETNSLLLFRVKKMKCMMIYWVIKEHIWSISRF